jgi:hypothetical protein
VTFEEDETDCVREGSVIILKTGADIDDEEEVMFDAEFERDQVIEPERVVVAPEFPEKSTNGQN